MAGSITHEYRSRATASSRRTADGAAIAEARTARSFSTRVVYRALVLLAASTMVFAAFTSSVRRPAADFRRLGRLLPTAHSVRQHGDPVGVELMLDLSRRALRAHNRERFQSLWTIATALGVLFLIGQAVAWQQLKAAGV